MLNVGGVANITFWAGGDEIAAFDTGPGNGMIDLLVQTAQGRRYDPDGKYASVGQVNEVILGGLLGHPISEAAAQVRWTATISRWSRWRSCSSRTPRDPGRFRRRPVQARLRPDGRLAHRTHRLAAAGGTIRRLMKAFAERLSVPVEDRRGPRPAR